MESLSIRVFGDPVLKRVAEDVKTSWVIGFFVWTYADDVPSSGIISPRLE